MNKYLLKYIAFCFIVMLLGSCNDSESDLLEPKVYFENKEYVIEVTDAEVMTHDLQARVSSLYSSSVEVSYEVADPSVVEAYNKKYGTEYETFEASNVKLGSGSSVVPDGQVYAELVSLQFSNLKSIEEGKSYLLPVRIKSASLPIIEERDIVYFVVTKPVRIMKVAKVYSNYIKVPLAPGTLFSSITYEALINVDWFGNNNTVMGCEGKLIFRIGDTPLVAANHLQIAGSKEFSVSQGLEEQKWYHVAFSYDQPTGKAAIYINGEKASEATWDTPNFDLTANAGGFFIGKVARFMWGERPFYGRMSEVRLWNVSRTENQIKQNMITVDPKSEGLAAYYKLNGTDQFQDGDTWKVKDASGHGMDGLVNGGRSALNIIDLDEPVTIK